MKVIIIGAGLIGAAIADRLALAGAQVSVIERAAPGAGTSGKSFGWINASASQTPEYYALRRRAIDRFRALSDEIDLSAAATWDGCLWWEDEGADFDTRANWLNRNGYEARVIGAAEFARLEPAVANPPERAILGSIEGAAEGDRVAQALLARAAAHGADLFFGREVTGLLRTGERVTGVVTDLGPMSADWVVSAAGPWAEALLAGSDVRLPMENRLGLIVHSNPQPPQVRHSIMSPDIHFRQTPDGRIILGEIFSGAVDKDSLPDITVLADELIARLRRRLPGCADLRRDKVMLGTRPVPADGLPVIGPARGLDGLYLASMHSGITLGPLVGELVAGELTTGTPDPALATFRHDRFN